MCTLWHDEQRVFNSQCVLLLIKLLIKQTCIAIVPEVVPAKQIVVLSLFDGDVNGSCSVLELQEISDADGLVGVWWASLDDDQQIESKYQQQQPQRPASRSHLLQLALRRSTPAYISARRLCCSRAQWVDRISRDWQQVSDSARCSSMYEGVEPRI